MGVEGRIHFSYQKFVEMIIIKVNVIYCIRPTYKNLNSMYVKEREEKSGGKKINNYTTGEKMKYNFLKKSYQGFWVIYGISDIDFCHTCITLHV